jgi:hypothetical protein
MFDVLLGRLGMNKLVGGVGSRFYRGFSRLKVIAKLVKSFESVIPSSSHWCCHRWSPSSRWNQLGWQDRSIKVVQQSCWNLGLSCALLYLINNWTYLLSLLHWASGRYLLCRCIGYHPPLQAGEPMYLNVFFVLKGKMTDTTWFTNDAIQMTDGPKLELNHVSQATCAMDS